MKKQQVYFVSLGCPKNRVDSEVMLGLTEAAGFEIARAPEAVEREVRDLVARGAVEINLVAQDLTTYGSDLGGDVDLARLVRRLGRVDGLRWLRLHYAYPTATTDALLDAIAEEPAVAKYI